MLVTRTTGVSRFFSSLTPLKQSGAKQSPVSNKIFMAAPFQRGQRRKKTGQGKSLAFQAAKCRLESRCHLNATPDKLRMQGQGSKQEDCAESEEYAEADDVCHRRQYDGSGQRRIDL